MRCTCAYKGTFSGADLVPHPAKLILTSVRIRNLQLASDDEADAVSQHSLSADIGIAKLVIYTFSFLCVSSFNDGGYSVFVDQEIVPMAAVCRAFFASYQCQTL